MAATCENGRAYVRFGRALCVRGKGGGTGLLGASILATAWLRTASQSTPSNTRGGSVSNGNGFMAVSKQCSWSSLIRVVVWQSAQLISSNRMQLVCPELRLLDRARVRRQSGEPLSHLPVGVLRRDSAHECGARDRPAIREWVQHSIKRYAVTLVAEDVSESSDATLVVVRMAGSFPGFKAW